MFAVAYRMLGRAEVAEEVTQDVFHAVWRRAGTYREDRGAARTWILAIARNAAIDRRRANGTRSEREVGLDAAGERVADVDVAARALDSLRDARVRELLAELSPEQRDALALAYWGGLSQSEIAARTGTPLGTVKSRVRTAMLRLRERLVEEA